MDRVAVLTAYNEQIRRATVPDGTGAAFEQTDRLVRRLAQPGHEGSGITWTDLDSANVDEVIAEQIAFFSSRSQSFEWKLFDYDQPADLPNRLLAAGLMAEEPESLVVAEVDATIDALASTRDPEGVRVERVTDPAGVGRMGSVQETVFGEDRSELTASILAQLSAAPELTGLFLAVAGDLPVSAARIELLPGTEFAGLWGGGTLSQWRGRGIYRSLVKVRAELAAERGYKYLMVDASDQSRPILERLGFTFLATTTPYIWTPPGQLSL